MGVVFLLENVVQPCNLVHWLVVNLVNLYRLHHWLWLRWHFLLWTRVAVHLLLRVIPHSLLQGHLCCEVVYLHGHFISWHVLKVLLGRAYIRNLLVKVDMFDLKNFVHDLSLLINLRSSTVFCTECGFARSKGEGSSKKWGSSALGTRPYS